METKWSEASDPSVWVRLRTIWSEINLIKSYHIGIITKRIFTDFHTERGIYERKNLNLPFSWLIAIFILLCFLRLSKFSPQVVLILFIPQNTTNKILYIILPHVGIIRCVQLKEII